MTSEFEFDSRLAANIHFADWDLSTVFLVDDSRFPWLVLVPRRGGIREIHDLSNEDQTTLMAEITRASKTLTRAFQPEKINIGAIGNMVPQLHIHVLGRREGDPLWPDPVWGPGEREPHVKQPYSDPEKAKTIAALEAALNRG
ncbi:MAG: HIT family protein [Proteobacteria bacterium]|nr:HIT family protein [Pseudomonadota bacterium]